MGTSKKDEETTAEAAPIVSAGDTHLQLATESLRQLLDDARIPDGIRESLRDDYAQVRGMLAKLEHGHLHVAVFGRVSVGKSSLLNALLGKPAFSVSVLHGETRNVNMQQWEEYADGGIFLIDTPGINEIDGEAREKMAHEVASRADLLLFVIDSDLTDVEFQALKIVASAHRPTLLVVNKADRYTEDEQRQLRSILRTRTQGVIAPENIVFTTAQSSRQTVIRVDENGEEHETVRERPINVGALKSRLWDIVEAEGKTLAALNASLFAGNLSGAVGKRILAIKREIGEKTIRLYCLGKGVAVALNPIPVADLVAAAIIDASMIMHLSKLYGLPISRNEAGDLVRTILAQMVILMGTVWAVHLVSSVLKLGTGGISTLITGATQGAVAWYSTLVVGRVAETWLANGKSWGDAGPKLTVQQILDSLDRDSVLSEAREEILSYLHKTVKN
ncbi:MAG: GTP-binding protein [Gammaproteobacteria bacterium]|nr:GTP-binding protein [Gammaproteobacteria bacterium]MBU1722443.1 GTP-binding protein [Gammaproteobacteria bacterium]MBU2004942.1 GTP-binding protein [Gammaproteobacteria bacterium]